MGLFTKQWHGLIFGQPSRKEKMVQLLALRRSCALGADFQASAMLDADCLEMC